MLTNGQIAEAQYTVFTSGLAIFYSATIFRADHVSGVGGRLLEPSIGVARPAARGCLSAACRMLQQVKHPAKRGLPRKAFRNEVISGGVSDHNI